MSQNPTYDPEPGYGMYDEKPYDHSGRSTPQRFYNSTPPTDQYSNMASYRQATTGPPGGPPAQSGGDPSNGKSYRYATEAIPEDEDEPDHTPEPDSGRRVQFPNGGEPTKRISNNYEESCWDKYKFHIMALLAVIFALLWVIFMGLYIQKVTSGSTGSVESTTPRTGEVVQTDAPTVPTTTVPVVESDIGEYPAGSGNKVTRFILTNINGMQVELLSLGARVNSINFKGEEIVPGFESATTATANLTEMAKSVLGSANGRICGEVTGGLFIFNGQTTQLELVEGETTYKEGGAKGFYQLNYEGVRMNDGVKFTRKVTSSDDNMPSITVEVMYTLNDQNQLKVVMNARNDNTNTNSLIDMCSSMRFNLDGDFNDITSSHQLQVYNDEYLDDNDAWLPAADALTYDFTTKKDFTSLVGLAAQININEFEGVYRLTGATGLRQAAWLESTTSNIKVMIHSNQDVLRMNIKNKDFELVGRETYDVKTFIGIMTHARPKSANNQDMQENILLKGDSVYEHITLYTFS